MIVLSFRSKKDKENLLYKAKEMEAYAAELVDCLEASHSEYEEDDYDYSERSHRSGIQMRGRYNYNRR